MSHPLIEFFMNPVLNLLGHPASLRKVIEQHPGLKARFSPQVTNIDEASVLRWNQFGENHLPTWADFSGGQVQGWARTAEGYVGDRLEVPELRCIGTIDRAECVQLDITDIFGLSASKSVLADFNTLADFAEARCQHYIQNMSQEGIDENLAHHEVGIRKATTSDFFVRYAWDGRIWLCNEGGSHHFAAAQWIAMKIGASVPLTGKLITHGLDLAAIERLAQRFRGFLISAEPVPFAAFTQAMAAVEAAYYCCDMGNQHPSAKLVLLPQSDVRSMRAAELLDQADFTDALFILRAVALQAKKNMAGPGFAREARQMTRP